MRESIARRQDVTPKAGLSKYGDVHFADEKNKKYPLDTEDHIRSAWSYIHHGNDAGKYSSEDVASIKRKIVSAWKAKVDKAGPPSASTAKESAPKGWEKTVSAMKQHPAISNVYALSHWMADKGYSPHKEASALVKRAQFECAQESLSPTSLGFLQRKGAKEAFDPEKDAGTCPGCGQPLTLTY